MSCENERHQQYYQELVRKARQTDLAEYLMSTDVKLRRVGRWYTLEAHDSYRIQGNKWYRNSTSTGGNAIDFLVEYYGITAKEAIERLTAVDLSAFRKSKETPKKSTSDGVKKKKEIEIGQFEQAGTFDDVLDFCEFDIADLNLHRNQRRVFAYLTKHRGITPDVVAEEIKAKNLFEEVQHRTNKKTGEPVEIHNAIFAIKDENGKIVGAEANGTLSFGNSRFKEIKTGSKSGYGYSTGERADPSYIMFFESGVDLLSFITIKREQGKPLSGCMLVSMAGLKAGIVKNSLEVFGKSAEPVFCVDNDEAGAEFIKSSLAAFPGGRVHQPDGDYKDWNDWLLGKKKDTH